MATKKLTKSSTEKQESTKKSALPVKVGKHDRVVKSQATEEKEMAAAKEVATLTVKQKKDLCKKAVSKLKDQETSMFDLAEILYEIYETAAYKDMVITDIETEEIRDCDSWKDFAEHYLNISKRTADYQVAMVKWFKRDLADDNVVQKVLPCGFSKVREMVGVVTSENVDEWVEKAKRMTATQFTQECRAARKALASGEDEGDEGGSEGLVRRSFQLFKDQNSVVTEAIEHASKVADSTKPGHILTLICTDYLAGAVRPRKGAMLTAYLERIEKNLGIVLTATRDGKLVHGEGAEELQPEIVADGEEVEEEDDESEEDESDDE